MNVKTRAQWTNLHFYNLYDLINLSNKNKPMRIIKCKYFYEATNG